MKLKNSFCDICRRKSARKHQTTAVPDLLKERPAGIPIEGNPSSAHGSEGARIDKKSVSGCVLKRGVIRSVRPEVHGPENTKRRSKALSQNRSDPGFSIPMELHSCKTAFPDVRLNLVDRGVNEDPDFLDRSG
jgi:hypothetical protein